MATIIGHQILVVLSYQVIAPVSVYKASIYIDIRGTVGLLLDCTTYWTDLTGKFDYRMSTIAWVKIMILKAQWLDIASSLGNIYVVAMTTLLHGQT